MYDQDKNVYSGLGIHLPLSEQISKPSPVKRSNDRYVSVSEPKILTASKAKKLERAAKNDVTVKNLTDALKLVVAVMIKNIIKRLFEINENVAIVCTAINQAKIKIF